MINYWQTTDAERLRVAQQLVRSAHRALTSVRRALARGDLAAVARNMRVAEVRYACAQRVAAWEWPELAAAIDATRDGLE